MSWFYVHASIVGSHVPRQVVFFFFFFFSHTSSFQRLDKPWSQVSSLLPPGSCLQFFFIAHRFQQSHCSSIFHRVLLTHALALSASQFVDKKKSQRIYTSMYSVGLELTKLTYYTRLEDNLIRHRGDRLVYVVLTGPDTSSSKCSRRPVVSLVRIHAHNSTRGWSTIHSFQGWPRTESSIPQLE